MPEAAEHPLPSRQPSWFETINPATGKTLKRYKSSTKSDVDKAVTKAKKAFEKWRQLSPNKRAIYLERTAKTLRAQKERLARIITQEMGKPIKESLPEVAKCAWALEYYSEHGPKFLNPETTKTDATDSYVAFEPLGVIGSIMPWNFPLWQCIRFAAPALMVGNTTVFKPSSITPQSGLALQNAFESTGSIPGCFNIVLGSAQVANYLIESDTVAVSFTVSVHERLSRKGSFYAPTILTNVTPEMRIMKEETFGPAAPVIVVKDENEAIRLANRSEFGLGATVWGTDTRRAEKVAREVSAGLVTVNNVVVSDPRMPFGGVRHSGIGRELSRYGMLEFTNIKSIRVYEKSPLAHAHVE